MKGMQKISRGACFAGVLSYAIDRDGKDAAGQIIGGNMSSTDAASLAREFAAVRQQRPDIEKAVWHNSLRLPSGEKLDSEKWQAVADDYMTRMGFSENHQRAYVLHDDSEGQHIHIIASRIDVDGKLYLGKNENLKSTQIISELERIHNLTPTQGTDAAQERRKAKIKKGEIEKAVRTNEAPLKMQIKTIIAAAVDTKPPPSATQFLERCAAGGVIAVPNIASTGKLNGFTFYAGGVHFKGSQVGFAASELKKSGVTYDQTREAAFLIALRDEHRRATSADAGATTKSGDANASRSSGIQAKGKSESSTTDSATINQRSEKSVAADTGNRKSERQRIDNKRARNTLDFAIRHEAHFICSAMSGKVKIRNKGGIKNAKRQLRSGMHPALLLASASAEVVYFIARAICLSVIAAMDEREQRQLLQQVREVRARAEKEMRKADDKEEKRSFGEKIKPDLPKAFQPANKQKTEDLPALRM